MVALCQGGIKNAVLWQVHIQEKSVAKTAKEGSYDGPFSNFFIMTGIPLCEGSGLKTKISSGMKIIFQTFE